MTDPFARLGRLMAQFFAIHPTHPQQRLIKRAVDILRKGGVIAYPTDSCYALGCHIGDARALERLRKLRGSLPADFKFDRMQANARGR